MGINTIQNTSSQEARLAASSSILSGDLISLTEGGQTYKASTNLTITSQNVTAAGVSAIYAFNDISTSANYRFFQDDPYVSDELGNGIFATAAGGNGTTGTTGVTVFYNTDSGAPYQPSTLVTSQVTIVSARIKKIDDSTFIVAWVDSTTNNLAFRIYNNDGTPVTSATTVQSIGAAGISWNFNVLNNSDIVFAYRTFTGSNLAFSRYNSSGVLQGTETVVEAASTPRYISILSHSSGDFWIYYNRSAATASYKFSRYNSSGVLQGANTTLAVSSQQMFVNWHRGIVELSNGNVIIQMPNNSTAYPDVYLYNSTGTLILSNSTWYSAFTPQTRFFCPILVQDGKFIICLYNNSSRIVLYTFTNSFNQIGPYLNPSQSVGSTSGNYWGSLDLFSDGSRGFTFVLGIQSGAPTGYATVFTFDAAGTLLGTLLNIFAGSAAGFSGGTVIRGKTGALFFTCVNSNGATPKIGIYNTSKKSLFGVSQENAAINATYRCATVGTFTINNVPLLPGSFDNRSATPAGAKGIIAGSTAILSGLIT